MLVFVNGSKREVAEALSLPGLLDELDLSGKPVVVELNEVALLPREYGATILAEGDRVEIVQITAGG
ncbi:sulfur carrier protein ThiS [Phragmitibacter flavus]|uniref:Sulfur carrier protein ThiS n=2 Tax=Phragmitibacter flavus TaxID=2576071 RepID=A0A5R8KIQ2_9BACT|nr:sulfur carrier protein ThiS [Phragmitibacter flavus]